ncbi:hypothetical protein NDU88_000484, partial [Pleurodeles waltl]
FFPFAFAGESLLLMCQQSSFHIHCICVFFSPLCVNLWLFRYVDLLKLFPHLVQMYGFSPVCCRRWMV